MPLFGLKKKQEETSSCGGHLLIPRKSDFRESFAYCLDCHISYSANSAYFAIATIAGVLVEVLAMLMLVKSANKTRGWFSV